MWFNVSVIRLDFTGYNLSMDTKIDILLASAKIFRCFPYGVEDETHISGRTQLACAQTHTHTHVHSQAKTRFPLLSECFLVLTVVL